MTVKERETEFKYLINQISTFQSTGSGAIVYISEVLGSGKTHTVLQALNGTEYIYVNSTLLKSKSGIYKLILEEMTCAKKQKSLDSLKQHLTSCNIKHIIVIDEIDLLISKKQEILYNLFDLPYLENSKVLLLIIANTFDLPERLLNSKMYSRIGKKRLNFMPYTSDQLSSIVNDDKVDQRSLELVSKRISSVTGDIRKINTVLKKAKETKPRGKVNLKDMDGIMKEIYKPL